MTILMLVTTVLADGTDVMFNKLNINDTLSSPDNASQHSNTTASSELNCVVAVNGVWKLSDCNEQHGVVCQSDQQIPGISIL